VRTKVLMFTLRLSSSGKAVHRAFGTQGQEAFLAGHLEAFAVLGGVPTVHVRYDNLKSAVSRVLFGRSRIESDRWVQFQVALRVRRLLLPARHQGRSREGRGRG